MISVTEHRIRLQQLAIGVGIVASTLLLWTMPATAHVNASGKSAGDGLTTVTFTFTHGCEGKPTTSLRIQLPEGTADVQPTDPTGWASSVDGGVLAWTGGTIPDGQPGAFTVTMRVPGTAGETVYLPTVQGCPDGLEEAWIARTADASATTAAPRIVLTETVTTTTTPTTVPTSAVPSPTTAATPATTRPPAAATSAPPTTAPTSNPGASVNTAPFIIGSLLAFALLIYAAYRIANRGSRPS